MYKLIENIHHGIPHKTIFQTDGNAVKLVKWSSSSDKKRPALVFIPGFLTECSATDELDIWTSRIRNIAQYYDLESWGLYWPSGNIDTLLGSKDWSLFMSASVRLSALPLGFTILPQILLYPAIATALGVGVMVAQRLLETWRKAVSRADEISMNPQWIQAYAEENLVGTTTQIWGQTMKGRYEDTVQSTVLIKRLVGLLLRIEV